MENLSEDRVERALQYHKAGFNCAQAVFAAFADLYGMDEETALRVSASFGGGIGRMQHMCGAASGMFMLAGFETGSAKAGDKEQKMKNYAYVRELAELFKAENGSLMCSEILAMRNGTCHDRVTSAARIWLENHERLKK